MRNNVRIRRIACIVLAACLPVQAETALGKMLSIQERAYELVKRFEIKLMSQAPAWAKIDAPPLFTFVWMSDFHMARSRIGLIKQALRTVDAELKPDFVMITGDNNSYAPEFKRGREVRDPALCRQRFMKRFLSAHLKTPYVIIPGDDWPQAFELVFGAMQFSFDYGGMHFLLVSLDRYAYTTAGAEVEGHGVFNEATWAWMRQDLTSSNDRPTLFVMHEPVAPPTFLDALKTQAMLDAHANVIAGLYGHLHLDLEFTVGRIKHLVCPSVGRSPRHGFKYVKVYRHALILRTVEYDEKMEQFKKVSKWQRIDIPAHLQGGLHRPTDGFKKHNYREVPPHARVADAALLKRSRELISPMGEFIAKHLTGIPIQGFRR